MKPFLPYLALAFIMASCSAAYKTGQTPDDVYFSPERPQAEYVRVDNEDDRYYRYEDRYEDRNDYNNYRYNNDRYLRMKIRNYRRWSTLDNDWFFYNPYAYGGFFNNFYYYNSPWSPYSYWDYYYNPYAPRVIVVNPKSPVYNRPRTTNLNVFNTTPSNSKGTNIRTRSYNQSNTNQRSRNFGDDLRNIFGNGSSENRSQPTYSPGRSSSSGSSGSSSSGSSGGGGGNAPVRRF